MTHTVSLGTNDPERQDMSPYDDVLVDGVRVGMVKFLAGSVALVVCEFCTRAGTPLPLFFSGYQKAITQVLTHMREHLQP
jgi:hypothetical protein